MNIKIENRYSKYFLFKVFDSNRRISSEELIQRSQISANIIFVVHKIFR